MPRTIEIIGHDIWTIINGRDAYLSNRNPEFVIENRNPAPCYVVAEVIHHEEWVALWKEFSRLQPHNAISNTVREAIKAD